MDSISPASAASRSGRDLQDPKELRYNIDFRVIDAKSFVPQHRERIFIAGFAVETDFTFDTLRLPDPLTGPKLGTILHPGDGSEKPEKPYTVEKWGASRLAETSGCGN